MEIVNHLLSNATFIKSPNFSERTMPAEIIILHCISLPEGEYGNNNVRDLFLNRLNINSHETFMSLKNVSLSKYYNYDIRKTIFGKY